MAYPIERKLVIAVASSALFDLSESGKVFDEQGEENYRRYQKHNRNVLLRKGVAFPFIRRFLHINNAHPDEQPVEVVLLSRNDPDTGLRVFHSIKEYELSITRAAFLSGRSPYSYMPAFNVSLFLSGNESDVMKAIQAGYPAGMVIPGEIEDDESDHQLRVAFDFDGVIADDEAEAVYERSENLNDFNNHETLNVDVPHNPGPLSDLFRKLSFFQKLERKNEREDASYRRILRTAIVTARSAPAHRRVVTTLNEWGVSADETFFLGGIEKCRILRVLKPHIFFDDQVRHLRTVAQTIPSVHVPFGVRNVSQSNKSKAATVTA